MMILGVTSKVILCLKCIGWSVLLSYIQFCSPNTRVFLDWKLDLDISPCHSFANFTMIGFQREQFFSASFILQTFVQGEVIKIMNLEKNDLEMKRKILNMTKYGNCERDRVDLILVSRHPDRHLFTLGLNQKFSCFL